MTIRIDGTLLVKKINSRNGPFCIGELLTDIGEFKIKDSLIDQFDEGKYQGRFWISQIYAHSYFAFGKVIIEIRARLADLQIKEEDALPSDAGKLQEIDPADEDKPAPTIGKPLKIKPVPKLRPLPVYTQATSTGNDEAAIKHSDAPSTSASSAQPDTTGTAVHVLAEDFGLFGEELIYLVRNGEAVKLDSTIDRQQFRMQIKRLGELGYEFHSKTQSWTFGNKKPSPAFIE